MFNQLVSSNPGPGGRGEKNNAPQGTIMRQPYRTQALSIHPFHLAYVVSQKR